MESGINDTIINDLAEKIRGITQGTIVISIHDSKIVQIDITRMEKLRFDEAWDLESGAGI